MREILGRRRRLLFGRKKGPDHREAALLCATRWHWPVLPGVGLKAAEATESANAKEPAKPAQADSAREDVPRCADALGGGSDRSDRATEGPAGPEAPGVAGAAEAARGAEANGATGPAEAAEAARGKHATGPAGGTEAARGTEAPGAVSAHGAAQAPQAGRERRAGRQWRAGRERRDAEAPGLPTAARKEARGSAEGARRPVCACPDPECVVPGAHPFDRALAATTDPRMVRWWWTQRPDAPVLLATEAARRAR